MDRFTWLRRTSFVGWILPNSTPFTWNITTPRSVSSFFVERYNTVYFFIMMWSAWQANLFALLCCIAIPFGMGMPNASWLCSISWREPGQDFKEEFQTDDYYKCIYIGMYLFFLSRTSLFRNRHAPNRVLESRTASCDFYHAENHFWRLFSKHHDALSSSPNGGSSKPFYMQTF